MAVVNNSSGPKKKETVFQHRQALCWVTILSTVHIREAFPSDSEFVPGELLTVWGDLNQRPGRILGSGSQMMNKWSWIHYFREFGLPVKVICEDFITSILAYLKQDIIQGFFYAGL